MGAHRRRPKVRCPIPITFVSAAVVVLLMILALISFLAPPLVDHDHSLVLVISLHCFRLYDLFSTVRLFFSAQ